MEKEDSLQTAPEAPEAINPERRMPGVTGDLRHHEFTSAVYRNTRFLRVWLPPRYDAAENDARHYPIFYLNDGQNLFDPATSFAGVKWAADEAADRLIRQEVIPPMILVGIDNAQEERLREFLPYRSYSPPVWRPAGKRYPDFLLREVMPFIAAKYRVARGPENTGLGGSSLGGLISLYTAMVQPGVFGRVLVESPSLWVSNRRIFKYVRLAKVWPEKIFVGVGTHEAGNDERDKKVVEDVLRLEFVLRKAGLGEERLRVRVVEGVGHNEGEWAKRFPEALEFLFGINVASVG
jgi:predicted alpha/beta superfamily hydrolase